MGSVPVLAGFDGGDRMDLRQNQAGAAAAGGAPSEIEIYDFLTFCSQIGVILTFISCERRMLVHSKGRGLYKGIKGLVRLFYPKTEVTGAENLPPEPVLVIGNHAKMNGPIVCELYLPGNHYTWCAGEMMHLKDVPAYAFRDFWAEKPKAVRWFYHGLSYVIAPFSVCVFNNANTIGVYHDTRILSTFKNTVKCLTEGANVVIFPEHAEPYNHIVNDFQDKFVDVARLYYKRTGKKLGFVPMYLAPALKKACLGEPVYFCPENDAQTERERICDYLKEQITRMAEDLPEHKVVPYVNIPKKKYPLNKR